MAVSRLFSSFHRRPQIDAGAATDIGLVRHDNEDAFGVFHEGTRGRDWLLIVADGMGGFERGSEASVLAVRSIHDAYYTAEGPAPDRLQRAFVVANNAVFERSKELGVRMGTTCTALSYLDEPVIGHVGDSRAYDVTPDDVRMVTQDHTLAAELQTRGVISEEEALTHPGGHALTRALGVGESVLSSIQTLECRRSPRWFVLCTDGLRQVSAMRVADVVRRLEPQQACEALVSEANKGGGQDNSTVVVTRVR